MTLIQDQPRRPGLELVHADESRKILERAIQETGATYRELAEYLHLSDTTIDRIMGSRHGRIVKVTVETAARIRDIDIEELHHLYAEPDFAIIAALLRGEHPQIPHGRKAEYIRYLRYEGLSRHEIAQAVRASGGDVRKALEGEQ